MSFSGQSPNAKRIRYTPQSADPVNPSEGDFFYSDGTPRAAGPWVYQSGAWQQVSTSGSLTTVNSITFSPQSSDPGTPVEGLVFYADGTSRSEGLWLYINSGWIQISRLRYQEFAYKVVARVKCATTAALTLVSQVENGDVIDGVTLATGDRVLIKNQATASENGIYTVNVSGAPTRATDANTASLLNSFTAYVYQGTVNAGTLWYQNATLSSLSDSQTWSSTIGTFSFTVPSDVTQLQVLGVGGGGAGGAGAGSTGFSSNGGGGAGGGGVQPVLTSLTVTPGQVLTITSGAPGAGRVGKNGTFGNGQAGADGGDALITGTNVYAIFKGGSGGGGGAYIASGTAAGGTAASATWEAKKEPVQAGNGGAAGSAGVAGSASRFNATFGTAGSGATGAGGGGGGGAGFGVGGNGTSGNTNGVPSSTIGGDGGYSAGGGGGGGAGSASGTASGGSSGCGGPGFIRVIW